MNPQALEKIKKEFAHIGAFYFNTAYFGPSPYRAKQKVSNALFKELDPSFYPYNTWMGISERIRQQIAQLLEVSTDNICHQSSSADIISIIANGHPFKNGDCVVALEGEYPSDVIPWMLAKKNRGIDFQLLDCPEVPTVEWLKQNLPEKTKIFNISHVSFSSGRKIDLVSVGKYLKSKDIFFVVDATQSLGGLKISKAELENIDVMTCSAYKWMLGPYGYAFGYFSDKALKLIQHQTGNWINSINSKNVNDLINYTVETLPGARKFDRGQTPNMLIMACLEASLELFKEIGFEEVQKHNEMLRTHFLNTYPKHKYDLITPKDAMGNIISLQTKSIDPQALETELKHNYVDVSVRQGKVRLSFHLFNTKEQVETLVRSLDI